MGHRRGGLGSLLAGRSYIWPAVQLHVNTPRAALQIQYVGDVQTTSG